MIDFPEDYFKTEIRDGFEITSMMKRAWAGADNDTALKILDCITTEAALEILKKSDILEKTMYQLTLRIEDVLQRRSGGKIRIGAIVFSNEYGILGKTKTADKLLEDIMENNYG